MNDLKLNKEVDASIASIIAIEEEAQKYQEKYKELTKQADDMRDKIRDFMVEKQIKSIKHASGCTVSIVVTRTFKVTKENELKAINSLANLKVDSFIVKTIPKHVEIDDKALTKWAKEHDIKELDGVDITVKNSLRIAN